VTGARYGETFRLDLNQSWEAIDIQTGAAVVIPKGSHKAARMRHRMSRDEQEGPWGWWSRCNTEASPCRPACAKPIGGSGKATTFRNSA